MKTVGVSFTMIPDKRMSRRNLLAHHPNITDTDERTKDLAIPYPRTHTPAAPRLGVCLGFSFENANPFCM